MEATVEADREAGRKSASSESRHLRCELSNNLAEKRVGDLPASGSMTAHSGITNFLSIYIQE